MYDQPFETSLAGFHERQRFDIYLNSDWRGIPCTIKDFKETLSETNFFLKKTY